MNRGKKIIFILLSILLLLTAGTLAVLQFGGWQITIRSDMPDNTILEYGEESADAACSSVTAVFSGKYFLKKGIELPVTMEPKIWNTGVLGNLRLTFSAHYLWYQATLHKNVHVVDTAPPVITLETDDDYYTRPNEDYAEEGFTAEDAYDGDLTGKVVRRDPGDGNIYYEVTDSSGNRAEAVRPIPYDDRTPPVITLNGDEEMAVEIGEVFHDPGVTATDDCDGNITWRVSSDTQKDQVVYTVSDSWGNETTAVRKLKAVDTTPPELTLEGEPEITIKAGESYTEPGYTAEDLADGDVSSAVTVSGEVNRYHADDYTLLYSVTDAAGNSATAERTVHVKANRQADAPVTGSKVVYLTFDDGPGAYTQQLLNLLAQYNVKVTFFVTNQYPSYQNLIHAEAAAGHTVGIHSYSHNYQTIYASEDAFFADVQSMQNIIRAQTGSTATILRFPGGSSNTVSSFNKGIMSKLTEDVRDMGYQYFDWNVSSGDAGGTTDTDTIASNVISGIQQHSVSVVLQHDIKQFSVNAVEKIIAWGIANGYTFRPLTADSPAVHHSVNN